MSTRRHLVAVGLAAALSWIAGCDSKTKEAHAPPPQQPPVVAPPATLPSVAVDPSTKPAIPPATSYLWFRQVEDPRHSQGEQLTSASPSDEQSAFKPRQFPRACLTLAGKGEDRVVLRLYSDDPKDALKRDWQGDRYYFHMPLQPSESAQLDDRPYRLSVPYDGADETSDGVFLEGDRYQLEPIDLSVRFETQGNQVNVYLGGLFKQVDAKDTRAEPVWYHIQGILPVTVEASKE